LPSIGQFKTKRITNPLIPEYELPSYETNPPVEIKFVRDSMNISDI